MHHIHLTFTSYFGVFFPCFCLHYLSNLFSVLLSQDGGLNVTRSLERERVQADHMTDHMTVSSGVGAMTWSPLACGIISGKYDGRVPPYSRASLKVDQTLAAHSTHPPLPSLIGQCHLPLTVFTPPLAPVLCFAHRVFVSFRCSPPRLCVVSGALTAV